MTARTTDDGERGASEAGRRRPRRGWARGVLLRRLLALALVLLAGLETLRPATATDQPPVLVTTRDLAPGTTLRPADVREVPLARALRPRGVLSHPSEAVDRVLAGAARQGEPLTDVRLVDSSLTGVTPSSETVTNVPLRVADPEVVDYLFAGRRVDVVAVRTQDSDTELLAADARVAAVRAPDPGQSGKGRLIIVELPRQTAARVAAVALGQPVTVTLR